MSKNETAVYRLSNANANVSGAGDSRRFVINIMTIDASLTNLGLQ